MLLVKKIVQGFIMGAAVLSLAACSTTGTGANVTDGSSTAGNNGVQTGGLGGDDGLPNANAMVPGANQHYYFDFNESNIHSADLPSIKMQAQYLISHTSATAQLQGNTDVRGSREYNLALGQRRADAVKKVLLLDGASAHQLSTTSYGAEKPWATGDTSTDYAKNRRTDMVYETH